MDYYTIYLKRLNRYGTSYQERIQNMRERDFELYLKKSTSRVKFVYRDNEYVGSFERYKQNETELLHYLLVSRDLNLANGTILFLPNSKGELKPWMVYYLEEILSSGYNKYIMLKMTHYITWLDQEGNNRQTWCYFYGQEDNMLKNELKSRSRSGVLYNENLKMSFFICPLTPYIYKEQLLTFGTAPFNDDYIVTGYDRVSTEGVMYVTVDPTHLHDKSSPPVITEEDSSEETFWLTGGFEE